MSRKTLNEDQSRAFIEAARELGCEESGEAFERAFQRIVPPRKPAHGAADEQPPASTEKPRKPPQRKR